MSDIVFNIISIIGVIAFSVAGSLQAIDHRVDLFGVVILAGITSFGGGVMRDMLIGNLPPLLFTDVFYYILAGVSCVTSVTVFCIARIFQDKFVKREELIDRITNVFDALALGIFATSGAHLAMQVPEASGFLVIAVATINAIGGGMIRDIILREVPFFLKKHIYALAVIAGASAYYLLVCLAVHNTVAVIVGMSLTFTLRILATVLRWDLPKAIK